MPHDIHGHEVKAGDRVLVECVVKAVHATDEYCNLSLNTVRPMYPSDSPSHFTLNAKQVRLVRHALNYASHGDIVRIQDGVQATDIAGRYPRDRVIVGGARAEVIATGSCVTDLRLLERAGGIEAGTIIGIDSYGTTGGGYFDVIERAPSRDERLPHDPVPNPYNDPHDA